MSRSNPVENYMDRFEWSKRDVVSYVRDLVELFGGVEAFAKALLCRQKSIEQVLRGDAPPEYVTSHLGIRFDNKSGKYYRLTPPEIYQLPDNVMPLRPAEWYELSMLRAQVRRLEEKRASIPAIDIIGEVERLRRKVSTQAQEIDKLSRENATLKRKGLTDQGVVLSPANDDPDRERRALFRQVYETFDSHVAFCSAYGLSRSYVYKVVSGAKTPGVKCDRVIANAIHPGKRAQPLDVVALCKEEIATFDSYQAFAAKYKLSRLSALNMAKGRIAQPRSKWRPVIDAALKRHEREKRDAA